MSEGMLFDVPEQKSPRLRWIERYGIKVEEHPGVQVGDEDPDTGLEMWPWTATGQNGITHGGATEHDALVALAVANGLRLWNE